MVSKKVSASVTPSPILIGNCKVVVEANNFTCQSDSNCLRISTTRNANIIISVTQEINKRCSNGIDQSKSEGEEGRASTSKDDYAFILVNSKDTDECSKSYLQEALKIYTRELPAMNYAANTGKQSMFLEKCVSNGKYCTLLLKFKNNDGPGEVIAAVSYQIVPADTQYAEIPLAAVSSFYQHKGLGRFLYMELRKRLWSVGVRVIYCWGDKESMGFWLKQGFESIAEVNIKGRVRKLPVKADIRRALSIPGGSVLMVSHLKGDYSLANYSGSMEFLFPLKTCIESSLAASETLKSGHGCKTLQTGIKTISEESCHLEGLTSNRLSGEENGICSNQIIKEPDTFRVRKCSKNTTSEELDNSRADIDVQCCSFHPQGSKRAWEASLSSLKSKKVKGSHRVECEPESIQGLDSESDGTNPSLHGCSVGISKSSSYLEATAGDPLTINYVKSNTKEGMPITMESGDLELKSHGDSFRIMLMNIADDTKKNHLTKVIEILGGVVTPNGSSSTHVVTGKVRKTQNFCTALCSGAWIVSSSWLKESFRRGKFVDESPYILHDEEYVLKYRMGLKEAVLRAKASPKALFKGYNVCIGIHVQPPAKTLSAIVMSAGGNIISGLDKVKETSNTIFIACEDDMEEVVSASEKGILTFSCDWLMNCIMRQELDLQALQFAESL